MYLNTVVQILKYILRVGGKTGCSSGWCVWRQVRSRVGTGQER